MDFVKIIRVHNQQLLNGDNYFDLSTDTDYLKKKQYYKEICHKKTTKSSM